MESLTKKVNGFYQMPIFGKDSILAFDRVLNMPLDYSSCFAVVQRGIHGKVDICQNDCSTPT